LTGAPSWSPGAGNVAIHVIEKVQQLGGQVIACSDTSGYVHDPEGIDVPLLKETKLSERRPLSVYAQRRGGQCRFVSGASVWEVPCRVALPCASQNELTGRDAQRLVVGGVRAVAEGANMPCTPEALQQFAQAGVCRSRPPRRPTRAALPPARSRCSRTPPAIAGPSSRPSTAAANHARHP
jgi:glutamate dehydrogenase/leucine dehydrogenase